MTPNESRGKPDTTEPQKHSDKTAEELLRNSSMSLAELDGPFQPVVEALRLFQIGLPSVLMQFALYWIFPVSASVVGRELGVVELGGFSLGALVGNLTCLSIMEGSLFAADTLMPRAFGAHRYEEVGRLAVRAAIIGFFLLAIPVLPLCLLSGSILQTLGQDSEASALAQSWIRMYFIGAAPNLVFRVLMRFLLAQNKPWRLVISSIVPSIFVHPFLLNHFVPLLGIEGSALAIAITQWLTLLMLLVLLWLKPVHKPETWPGLSWEFLKGACELDNTMRYLRLAVGGILSVNEWWFFEIMCFIAGSFGVESLDAHTIAYNLVPLFFMLPLGVGIGLAIRMGTIIGLNPTKARMIAAGCMGFITVAGAFVSTCMHFYRNEIIALFTEDDLAKQLALSIWPLLCYYMFLIYIMGISVAILRALGMQWRAAGIISTSLFCCTLPLVLCFAVYRHGGLVIQWRVLAFCYTFLQIVLALGYLLVDWDKHAIKVRESIARMAVGKMKVITDAMPSEITPLVV
ncbi:hypothetical protein ACA910_014481 [Epithemia clementina (nom. ined.)]